MLSHQLGADKMQRIDLVTGANKGIGKEIARGLARSGFFVFLGARDLERGAAAASNLSGDGQVEPLRLDVVDQWSIDGASCEIDKRFARLDVLVNNAGIAAGSTRASEESAESLRMVYDTNVFGVVRVINTFLPLLRRSDDGRIVNVTSLRGSLGDGGAWLGQPSMAYSSSKTALNAITMHYARDLKDTSIRVYGAAPGHVATDFNGFRGKRTPAEGAAIAVRLATEMHALPSGGVFDDDRQLPW
jgi:NAD(P)-dependent dehydrogenase (short-subunit alcohol dehydrogenase family)